MNLIISIVALLLSGVAMIISLCVARKQNKIGLFQCRYEVYKKFKELKKFNDSILKVETLPPSVDEWKQIYMMLFFARNNTYISGDSIDGIGIAVGQIEEDKDILNRYEFLFKSNINTEHFRKIIDSYYRFAGSIFLEQTSRQIDENKKVFLEAVDESYDTIMSLMDKQIRIVKKRRT